MKRTRHTAGQIIRKLKTAEQLIAQGKTVADVFRVIEVTQPTYNRWLQQYGGIQAEEARRLDSAGEGERPDQEASGRSGVGEGHAQGPCCAVRRTLWR